ncbi:reverse transcriptase family protein [Variovorax sp. NFACC27]|uniref:reverse transcriptase family protein n=1 Tax=unclassified Variovorax TaxID=663243 RepID=UPI00089C2D08|nr:RNA-directed DNA polymerase [Variovorax sp. NFACC28]SEG96180.1 RNA-directed DNA polymerase [Variovorax sp. NFACC29]SFD82745.1 RNA-directed DNA polymerase [Variovorax sp. NFACC26]SFG94817.1 RNA-directed DNA polymerase [Variovorax sp. NFACC27]
MTRELSYREWIARSLARALLADARQPGGTAPGALRARAAATLGADSPWLKPLAEALGNRSQATWQRTDLPALAKAIHDMPELDAAFEQNERPRVRRIILRPAQMLPRPMGLDHFALPDIPTLANLAQWLALDADRLAWLASPAQAFRASDAPGSQPASHYRYQLQPKRLGGLRLLEIPKADLKRAQRRILDELLRHVPVHEAAHGFVQGRSVASHAAAHAGKEVVIGFDLRDFFPAIRASRVHATWRTLGYPEGVARALTALCTHRTDAAIIERLRDDGGLDWMGAKRLAAPHLPQGSPCSPALANLCAFRLDLRLEGLAWVFGATYTRYADDLVFSGPASLRAQFGALRAWVDGIAADEGFELHPRKLRCMPRHRQQRVTGVVVNDRANAPREDFDRLRAVLHRCATQGPAAQNRAKLDDFRGHLLGHIAWIGQFNAARKARLMRLFERIDWTKATQTPS